MQSNDVLWLPIILAQSQWPHEIMWRLSMHTRFTLHCIDRFPLVIFQPELVQRCDASVWIREMEALIDRRKPFIVISPPSFHKESCEDFHLRRKWVMRHRLLLATYCRAFVSIEPNVKRKDEMSAMALGFAMTWHRSISCLK